MIAWPVILSGFILGAAGSFHCIGMCGPLSMALPVSALPPFQKFISLLSYQLGRIITYTTLGLILGLAGRRIYTAGYQQSFSIAMGIIVLVLATLYFTRKKIIHFKAINRFYFFLSRQINKILKGPVSISSFLLLGMANGLLPCGMIYVALGTSLSFSTVPESMLFMTVFGAGTLPAMMMVGYAGNLIHPDGRLFMKKMVPVFVSLVGILLILRGLNLGIPFISPELPSAAGRALTCHP